MDEQVVLFIAVDLGVNLGSNQHLPDESQHPASTISPQNDVVLQGPLYLRY